MSFYTEALADADASLVELGQMMTLERKPTGKYDVATATPARASISFECFGVVLDFPQELVDGTLIAVTDKKVLLSAKLDTIPVTGDVLVQASGAKLTIVSVKALAPAGLTVLYTIQAR